MTELSPMKQDPTETVSAGARVPSRELVVLAREPDSVATIADRPLAGFVAQLIACRKRLPAYRAKGRASPEAAMISALLRQAPSRVETMLARSQAQRQPEVSE